ncbi:hypothetical protein [Parafrankia sp. CH37]|uniref:hypothetical protein n=1 Tax=Parafrankia sp. CH37 TaxID=683308 RepID=UPI000B87670C|nr:hypothetical protein [Parafrankia sp. CH37]
MDLWSVDSTASPEDQKWLVGLATVNLVFGPAVTGLVRRRYGDAVAEKYQTVARRLLFLMYLAWITLFWGALFGAAFVALGLVTEAWIRLRGRRQNHQAQRAASSSSSSADLPPEGPPRAVGQLDPQQR